MPSQIFHIQLANSDIAFDCSRDDTLLRAALRQGLAFPYECNVGSCGNCKFEVLQGANASNWDAAPALSDKDRLKNRQLGCQCRPLSDMTIKLRTQDKYRPIHPPLKHAGRLIARRAITHDLCEFAIELAKPMAFSCGQYALVQIPGVLGQRAYSMSNAGGCHQAVEVQVRRGAPGTGSAKLFDLSLGSEIEVDGPYGMAFLRADRQRDILCVAGGSGLAPMLSIARGALAHPNLVARRVHFLYGGRTPRDICGLDLLQKITTWNDRGSYQAVVSAPDADTVLPENCLSGYLHEAVDRLFGERLAELEIYFAGPVPMTEAMLRTMVERKVHMDHVHFDQFY